jgi:hypothetical protein
MKGYWDHKTKPSTFVVVKDGQEIYRGPFEGGYKLISLNRCYKTEVAKYFKEPECLTPKK